jgi:hypothetical protein
MAHFAEVDESGTVQRVLVVSDDDAPDEIAGQAFLAGLYGGDTTWVQTSYNGNMRKQYAGVGCKYDPVADVFVSPSPFPSWVLDANHDWQPPVPMPEGDWTWDEATLAWVDVALPQPVEDQLMEDILIDLLENP